MSGEQSSGPTTFRRTRRLFIHFKADGKIYWNSNEFAETYLLEGVISKGMTVQNTPDYIKDKPLQQPGRLR